MGNIIIKKSKNKGLGVFASRNIKKGEKIMQVDLTKLKKYSLKELEKHPQRKSEHWDFVGRGKYVLTFHPYSYINHSCDSNVLVKHKTIAISDFFAMRDIKKGEELTYDYGVNAIDQFGKGTFVTQGPWVMKCKCGSKNCREKISADFLKQPKEIQRKYYKYLPISIKKKFKNKLKNLTER